MWIKSTIRKMEACDYEVFGGLMKILLAKEEREIGNDVMSDSLFQDNGDISDSSLRKSK